MKFLSYGVMIYMLLALVWWTILLSRNNRALYERNLSIHSLTKMDEQKEQIATIHQAYHRNKYMIIGEGLVFGISLIIGMWFIQKAYTREVNYTSSQKNFLLSITHELKSPLAAINLISETIIKRNLPTDQVNELQQSILSESVRLEKLINNLLFATKIDSGYQYNFEPFNLTNLVKETIKRIEVQHTTSTMTLRCPDDDIIIQADQEALYSVVNN